MNQKTYDAGILFGTLMVGVGTATLWDAPTACIVVGAIVLVLTVIGAWLSKG